MNREMLPDYQAIIVWIWLPPIRLIRIAKNDLNETDIVPGLILENETEIRRFYEGLNLKIMSKQKRDMLKSDFSHLTVDEIKNLLSNENCKVSF